jgi:hypothetical protein
MVQTVNQKAAQRKYKESHREKINAYRRQYYLENRDRIYTYKKKYREAHPNIEKQYRLNTKLKLAQYKKQYRELTYEATLIQEKIKKIIQFTKIPRKINVEHGQFYVP